LRWRLSLLLFLQFAVPGSILPFFTLRLQELGFSPIEMSVACATQAIAAIVAPLLAGQIADRWFPAERCVTVLTILAAGLLWTLSTLTSPLMLIVTMQAFWLVQVPSLTLGTVLAFAHQERGDEHFGRIRLWGTVGWAAPSWLLGYWFSNPEWLKGLLAWLRPDRPASELADVFRLSAAVAVVLVLYTLTLPHTPPQQTAAGKRWAFVEAFKLVQTDRGFAVYFICFLGICVTLPFMLVLTPLLLADRGLPKPWIGPAMTISQSTEVFSLALLPMMLLRLGLRGTMLVGLMFWALTLGILTAGEPTGAVVASLGGYGVCICCFLVSGQVFVNSRARGGIRASAQALITFTSGIGLLAGNLLIGWLRQATGERFPAVFGVAVVAVVVLTLLFFAAFPDLEDDKVSR
jgi:MFS family permease